MQSFKKLAVMFKENYVQTMKPEAERLEDLTSFFRDNYREEVSGSLSSSLKDDSSRFLQNSFDPEDEMTSETHHDKKRQGL